MRKLRAGDRIRLKVKTLTGWIGTGAVICDQSTPDSGVVFQRDGYDSDDTCDACRHEVVLLRKDNRGTTPRQTD